MKNEITTLPQEKEVAEYKTRVLQVQQSANDFEVASGNDMARGADILHVIKQVEDSVIERKEAITRPLMAALSSVREMFKPLELGYADAKKTIKSKMLSFQIAEDERVAKEKSKIEARVEKGTMRADTAMKKLEGIEEAPKTVSGSVGRVQVRRITKWRVVDAMAIPRGFLTTDDAKITEAVLRLNIEIPGIERYEEKTMASH